MFSTSLIKIGKAFWTLGVGNDQIHVVKPPFWTQETPKRTFPPKSLNIYFYDDYIIFIVNLIK